MSKTHGHVKLGIHRAKFPGVMLISLLLLLVLCLGGGLSVAWYYLRPVPSRQPAHPATRPAFQPVVGDVNDPEDDDPDITVQQPLVPGFQFQRGGFQLSGRVLDAQSGQSVANAVVWITLPPKPGTPTSPALHTVTDTNGFYQFQHLAADAYTLAASRYYNLGDGRYYGERIFALTLAGDRSGLELPLHSIPDPGQRTLGPGQAKNLILIDLRGFYAQSLLADPLLADQTSNLRDFLQHSYLYNSLWHPYGWHPLDQYALLTGTYPAWATYDTWPHPVPWGEPDNLDINFWFTGGRVAHLFGQSSLFDVAKGAGMQTAAVASSDYLLSDATTRNLDLLQQDSSFVAANWLGQMESAVIASIQKPAGFLLYGELAPLASDDLDSSPDALGDAYQQALLVADQVFGQFLSWLAQQGLLQNTLVALTTSQAQANHTDADNFYGMGTTGQGSSKQTLLALSWSPGCRPTTLDTEYSTFIIAPVLLHILGLSAPAEAYFPAMRGCL
jgi:hypothetical protein